eukprot:TRINITY_DN11775_c0_g2_i2.p1 TRINITY_DN11775_c0_g2~~TRINITY_DN11775_c0_g2_i2.p1  ORF type:complete len:232 (+),score=30.58 TRINITY_DN11775_c0_g2_i2:112-807(+)
MAQYSLLSVLLMLALFATVNASDALIWRVHHAIPDLTGGILPGYVDIYVTGAKRAIVTGLGFGGTTLPVYIKPEIGLVKTVPHLATTPVLIERVVAVEPSDYQVYFFLIGSAQLKSGTYLKYNITTPPARAASCYIRIGHFSPDTGPVNIFLNNQRVARGVPFSNISAPAAFPVGTYSLSVEPVGTQSKIPLGNSINCTEGGNIGLFVEGLSTANKRQPGLQLTELPMSFQ